jgi:hypothetical protein
MAKQVQGLLDPEGFTSGLIDDIDLTITAAVVEEYDFEGKAIHGNACSIHLTLTDDEDGAHEQYYPIGQADAWVPTDDGKSFQPVTGKTGINKNSAGAKFIAAAIEKGFPKTKLASDVTVFVGYKFHFKQVVKGKDDEGKEKTLLLPTKLVSAPGEKSAKKGASKPAAAASTAAPSGDGEVDPEVAAKAVELSVKALAEAGTKLTLDGLSAKVFKMAVTDKGIEKGQRQQIVALVQDTDWVDSQQGPKTWVYDAEGGTVEGA